MASLEECLTLYNLDPADADQIRQLILNRQDSDMRAALDEFVAELEEERQDVLNQIAAASEVEAQTFEDPRTLFQLSDDVVSDPRTLSTNFQELEQKTFATGRELKVWLQDKARERQGELEIDLTQPILADTPTGVVDGMVDHLGPLLAADARYALQDNAGAIGWYDRTTAEALRIAGLVYPEINTDPNARMRFIWALATTSNGIKVDKNFDYAAQAYEGLKKNGRFPTIEAGEASAAINHHLQLYHTLSEAWGDDALRHFMMSEMTVAELKKLTGIDVSGENAGTVVRGAAILGAKIGNGFYSNLNGVFDALTIDRWNMRTMGRLRGTLIDDRPDMVEASGKRLQAAIDVMSDDQVEFLRGFFEGRSNIDAAEIGPSMTADQLERFAREIKKRSASPEWRENIANNGTGSGWMGDEIRLAGNSLHNWLDGQVEIASNGSEREMIRRAHRVALENLQSDPNLGLAELNMSDLQALLWYPEKRLYDAAKQKEGADRGYGEDEAPDYANAARAWAERRGVSVGERSEPSGAGSDAGNAVGDTGQPEGDRGLSPSQWRDFRRRAGIRSLVGGGNPASPRSVSGLVTRKSLGDGARVRGLNVKQKLTAPRNKRFGKWMSDMGVALPPVYELDASEAQTFSDAITASKEAGKYGAAVYVYPVEEYADMRLYMTEDGGAGFAIKSDGDIVSVFSTQPKGSVDWLMQAAIDQGGRKLDAFDTVLPSIYSRHGFKVVERLQWDDQYAPDGWDYDTFGDYKGGRPDVVFMEFDENYYGMGDELLPDDGGRVLEQRDVTQTPEFQDFISDSKVQDLVYHSTTRDFEAFKALSHFGTMQAAHDRQLNTRDRVFDPREGENLIPAYIRVTNPLFVGMEDDWQNDVDMFTQVAQNLKRREQFDLAQQVEDLIQSGPRSIDTFPGGVANAHMEIVELLEQAGYDGIEYTNAIEDFGSRSYVVFRPEQIKSPFNAGTFDRADPRMLAQGPRGSIQLPSGGVMDGTKVINLFESENTSTFFHEIGHLSLEAMITLAADEVAPQQLQDDMATVREYLGMEADQMKPTTEQHETWARTFEAYLMEGKSPSLDLTSAMGRIKAWFSRIYGTVRALNVNMTEDVREVLDRMLATSEQIELAQQEVRQTPMFSSAPEGMSSSEWQSYQKLAQRRTAEADRQLLDKTMEVVRRRKEQWWKDREVEVRAEVEAELSQRPVYQAIQGMTDKDAQDKARFDKQELIDVYGEQILQDLTRDRHRTRKHLYTTNAARLDEIADFYGYERHQDLIRDLQSTEPYQDVVERETRGRMEEIYGDPLMDGTIESEALEAIHNDQAGQVMAAELRVLARSTGRPDVRLRNRMFKARAQAILDDMQERHVLPDQFLTAERKAARTAEIAFRKVATGKNVEQAMAEAYQAKEQQVLNHHLYMLARDWRKRMDRMRSKMRSYSTPKVRQKIGSPHIEQIEQILEDYDFKKRTQRDVESYLSLNDYIDVMIAQGRGGELALDARVVQRANQQHYSRLTVNELNGVFDTVTNIEQMGRRKNEVRTKRRTRELNVVAEQLVDTALESQKLKKNQPEGIARGVQKYTTSISRMDLILARLDGGQEMGPWYDAVKRDLDEAVGDEQRRQVQLSADVLDLYNRHYTAKELADLPKEKNVDGGGVFSKEEIIALALNTGTESNYQRLMDKKVPQDQRMSEARLSALLSTLDERDWRFVQDVWDYINSYWGDLAAVEQRTTGVVPKKVEAKMMYEGAPDFVRGGYYRLYYDADRSQRAERDEASAYDQYQDAGWGARAHVANGMTFERKATAGGRPVDLKLINITRQLNDTVRLIALKEAVDATQRVINHPDIDGILRNTAQREVKQQMQLWLDDIAVGPIYNADWANTLARTLKNNFTLSRLAFNVKTIALQLTGASQSLVTVGPVALMDGYYRMFKGMGITKDGVITEITEMSPFMAERVNTFQKDINDFFESGKVTSVFASKYQRGKEGLARAGFAPIQLTQFYGVDVPTWLGAFQQASRDGKSEADAINYADRMVARSQDSGLMSDRAGVERGTMSQTTRQADVVRVWTTLAGYMLTKLNRANMQVLKARYGWRNTDSAAARTGIAIRLALEMMVLFLTEPAAMALAYMAWADEEDREADDVLAFMARETGSAMVGGLPVFRDILGDMQGYTSGGIYGAMTESGTKAYTQIMQGELDSAAAKSVLNVIGLFTGAPTTQAGRIVGGILDAQDTGETNVPAMVVGANPLSFR